MAQRKEKGTSEIIITDINENSLCQVGTESTHSLIKVGRSAERPRTVKFSRLN